MIDFGAVTQAVHATLTDTGVTVAVATAPASPPTSYAVLELPPGAARTGTLTNPEAMAVFRCRIRSVAKSNQVDVARREAQRVATILATALLDRTATIDGDGWEITGRSQDGDGGILVEGDVVNHVADFVLEVAQV